MTHPTDSAKITGRDGFVAHIEGMFAAQGRRLFAELASGPLSYADCWDEMNGFARLFAQLGLSHGHRALVVSGNDRSVIALFLALLRAGVIPIIADPTATLPESLELVELCKADVVFSDADHPLAGAASNIPVIALAANGKSAGAKIVGQGASAKGLGHSLLRSVAAGTSQDTAVLVLTSGTTSTPKAVALSHSALLAQLEIFRQVYGFDAETRLLNVLPLHHVDGLIRGPLTALWFGGSLHRGKPFSVQSTPEMLAAVADLAITHLITVPAMLRIIERVGRDTPQIFNTPAFRFVICSADLLEPALWRRVEATFGVVVVNAYGLSEVVCDALFAGPQDRPRRIGTLGRPVGCTARALDGNGKDVPIGEIGELVLSGATVMSGYFGAPEATALVLKDGAFFTGDFVRVDADGIYEFVGRKKTAIVSAGFTIHPETASQVLSAMPGVHEAVAFGVPDPAMGERLVAAIVLAPGAAISVAELADYCRSHLSRERSPREFRIVPLLPRGASGKVLLSELAQLMQDKSGPAPAADVLTVAAKCFNVAVENLSSASTPFNTEGWDSLAHMALIDALEAAFSMQFSAMQIAQIISLGDAERFIGETVAAAGKAP